MEVHTLTTAKQVKGTKDAELRGRTFWFTPTGPSQRGRLKGGVRAEKGKNFPKITESVKKEEGPSVKGAEN